MTADWEDGREINGLPSNYPPPPVFWDNTHNVQDEQKMVLSDFFSINTEGLVSGLQDWRKNMKHNHVWLF